MTDEKTILILHVPSMTGPAKPGPRFFLRLMDRNLGRTLIEVQVSGDIEVTQEHMKDGRVVTKHLGQLVRIEPNKVEYPASGAGNGPDSSKPAEHPAGSTANPGATKEPPMLKEEGEDARHRAAETDDAEDKKHNKGGKQK